MRDKVRGFIDANALLCGGERVIVALSGGADSVTLLHLLVSLKELYQIDVSALHFNHMIRGEEAERDERFCRALCVSLGVPLTCARADVPSVAAETQESLELCGRRLRYDALEQRADALGGARIATAHTLSDNTETVLMNLIRGAGVAGLSGIPVRRGAIIRPLLCCTREEVEAYAAAHHLDYVTDSTNLSDAYTRNRLRLNVLPLIKELNPSLDEGVQRTAALMRDADEYISKNSLKELNNCKTDCGYACDRLLRLDRAVLGCALRHILSEAGAPVDHKHIELLTASLADGGSVDLGRGYRAVCAQGILRIINGEEAVADDFCIPAADYCRERCRVVRLTESDTVDPGRNVHKKSWNHAIPCDIITQDAVVRHRRAGDTFTDPRRGQTKTIKKLLNELKIPRERRDRLIVIARGSTVLWLEGLGAAKQAAIPAGYSGEVFFMDN